MPFTTTAPGYFNGALRHGEQAKAAGSNALNKVRIREIEYDRANLRLADTNHLYASLEVLLPAVPNDSYALLSSWTDGLLDNPSVDRILNVCTCLRYYQRQQTSLEWLLLQDLSQALHGLLSKPDLSVLALSAILHALAEISTDPPRLELQPVFATFNASFWNVTFNEKVRPYTVTNHGCDCVDVFIGHFSSWAFFFESPPKFSSTPLQLISSHPCHRTQTSLSAPHEHAEPWSMRSTLGLRVGITCYRLVGLRIHLPTKAGK